MLIVSRNLHPCDALAGAERDREEVLSDECSARLVVVRVEVRTALLQCGVPVDMPMSRKGNSFWQVYTISGHKVRGRLRGCSDSSTAAQQHAGKQRDAPDACYNLWYNILLHCSSLLYSVDREMFVRSEMVDTLVPSWTSALISPGVASSVPASTRPSLARCCGLSAPRASG